VTTVSTAAVSDSGITAPRHRHTDKPTREINTYTKTQNISTVKRCGIRWISMKIGKRTMSKTCSEQQKTKEYTYMELNYLVVVIIMVSVASSIVCHMLAVINGKTNTEFLSISIVNASIELAG